MWISYTHCNDTLNWLIHFGISSFVKHKKDSFFTIGYCISSLIFTIFWVQMRVTKIEEGVIIEEVVHMGGDLNRLKPTKMEDFSKRQATWISLKEEGSSPTCRLWRATMRTVHNNLLFAGRIDV